MKKYNKCSCTQGFTGQFCEQKEELNNLLFVKLEKTLIFDADGNIIQDNVYIESNLSIQRACSTILNGEATIFGGSTYGVDNSRQVRIMKIKFLSKQFFDSICLQISVVTNCSLKYIGELPFDLEDGTCNTFNVNGVSRIFLCFSRGDTANIIINPDSEDDEIQKCRMLTRKNFGFLVDIKNFIFDLEFDLDILPNSIYSHHRTTIANYKGWFLNENFVLIQK